MRLLHLADTHLDRPFVGLPLNAARHRRDELRRTFEHCLELAREHWVDLVTIGGDLWEEEHVTADTRNWVAAKLAELKVPVAVICGNHDPLVPGGDHLRTAWPANVHLFPSVNPTEFAIGDVSIWGASWSGGGFSTAFLDGFKAPRDGRTHVLLLHGTTGAGALLEASSSYGPFDAQAVTRAGFLCCLAGHIHAAQQVGPVVYPGSPEPLGWSETHRHCVALVELAHPAVRANVELIDVNSRAYTQRTVNVDGAVSSADVEQALDIAVADPDPARLYVRLTLTGMIAGSCRISPENLAARYPHYAGVLIVDQTCPSFDFGAIAQQPTALGRFVSEIAERISASEEPEKRTLELARIAGVRAMRGDSEVLHVD
jgi:DNA repair protein SbcD/Mre11